MRIDYDVKLDFDDVLLVPKRSSLESRKDVELTRSFKFLHSDRDWEGIPIIAANMSTVGTWSMARTLAEKQIMTCLHKFVGEEENRWSEDWDCIVPTFGASDSEFDRLKRVIQTNCEIWAVCLDVANGYQESFVDFVKRVRDYDPGLTIIAGNVVTAGMTEALVMAGADVVKVGIGSGCHGPNTKVLMSNGQYKAISRIQIGDRVINKDGAPVRVKGVSKRKKKVVKLNTAKWHEPIEVTLDHKYWVGDLSSTPNTKGQSGVAKLLDKNTKKGESKYKWKEVDNFSEYDFLLTPKHILWELPESFEVDLNDFELQKSNGIEMKLRSSYTLGYVIGGFLGNGSARICDRGSGVVRWHYGTYKKKEIDHLVEMIHASFGYQPSIHQKTETCTTVVVYNTTIARFFLQFGKRTEKHLPKKYMTKDSEFNKGLFDGLVQSDGSIEKNGRISFTNTSEKLIELFNFLCLELRYSFSNERKKKTLGNLKNAISEIEDLQQPYAVRTHTSNHYTMGYSYSNILSVDDREYEQEVWDIEVDCPTNSFVANNVIVHNSACTTRIKTGVGMPQFSAIMECADAAHGLGAQIISDGGCRTPGDVVKAFGAGADFVMLGGMLAGHDECEGEIVEDEIGKLFMQFYGMSSAMAQETFGDGVNDYATSEGREVLVPYKGLVENTIQDILGGLRSACTYVGAKKLKELTKRATFVRVNSQYNTVFEK